MLQRMRWRDVHYLRPETWPWLIPEVEGFDHTKIERLNNVRQSHPIRGYPDLTLPD
jgi:hypothetical protein